MLVPHAFNGYVKMDMIDYLMSDTSSKLVTNSRMLCTIILEEVVVFDTKSECNLFSYRQNVCKAFIRKFVEFRSMFFRNDQCMSATERLDIQKCITDE
jgi:hypothetical protein